MNQNDLMSAVLEEQRSWGDPVVERSVFGTDDPSTIVELLSRFCETDLGAKTASVHFYRVSTACVAGLDLDDGRSVVIKAQRKERRREYLAACADFRRLLFQEGFPCPRPLAGPSLVGSAWMTAEELSDSGAPGDAHDPAIRLAITRSLAQLVEISGRFGSPETFGRAWFSGLPEGRVFPKPHSPFFDFEATRKGAEWIEALAAEARERRKTAQGERAVGHFDYRVEHLRFAGGEVVASYDWDSLHHELVPVLVGSLAPHFTADWQREDLVRAPSVQEMRAFAEDFEACRKQAFTAAERETLSAALVFAMAYTARCNHAGGPEKEGWNGDLRPLLREHGRALLDCGLWGI